MKPLHLLILVLFLPALCNSQNRHSGNKYDFSRFYIGPEIGGLAYMALYEQGEGKFYAEYSLGGRMDIRPFRPIGIQTGFSYHKAVNEFHYYSSPLFLYFYNKNNVAFIIGPVFNFDARGDKVDFNNPTLGGAIGTGTQNLSILLFYNPKLPIFRENIQGIRYFIGLGIRISFGISF